MTHDYGSHVFKRKFNDYISSSGRVSLGNNIYIGRDVTIMKGVSIGDNCIIGLGSIVTKDIPSNSVACGIPCKVVSSIDNYFIKRKQLQISEALSYGRSIILRFNREPQITDFTEEWVLFMSKEDYYTYPEMRKIIDKRIGDFKADFFENNKLAFNGFNEF